MFMPAETKLQELGFPIATEENLTLLFDQELYPFLACDMSNGFNVWDPDKMEYFHVFSYGFPLVSFGSLVNDSNEPFLRMSDFQKSKNRFFLIGSTEMPWDGRTLPHPLIPSQTFSRYPLPEHLKPESTLKYNLTERQIELIWEAPPVFRIDAPYRS